tara:strand:+ start:263 stop:463 length:201 start_codon:yes stop_codon:yes gene_type:complete
MTEINEDRGPNDLERTIETLRQRIKDLLLINNSHKDLMGKLIAENKELKLDNKRLAKELDDYYNAR